MTSVKLNFLDKLQLREKIFRLGARLFQLVTIWKLIKHFELAICTAGKKRKLLLKLLVCLLYQVRQD